MYSKKIELLFFTTIEYTNQKPSNAYQQQPTTPTTIKMSSSMSYLPNLFIRDVGKVTDTQIYQVIENLGFGRVNGVVFKGNNAIAYMDWDISHTIATRMLLQEGQRPLLLYYSDDRFWKVFAYKTLEERENLKKEKLRQEKLLQEKMLQEKLRQQKERRRCEEEEKKRILEKERCERLEQERLQYLEEERIRREEELLLASYAAYYYYDVDDVKRQDNVKRQDDEAKEENEEDILIQDLFYNKPENIISSLDYGNATEHYPMIRSNIRARMGLMSM